MDLAKLSIHGCDIMHKNRKQKRIEELRSLSRREKIAYLRDIKENLEKSKVNLSVLMSECNPKEAQSSDALEHTEGIQASFADLDGRYQQFLAMNIQRARVENKKTKFILDSVVARNNKL